MYIIGDVAGEFNTLMALVAKFNPNEEIVLLGDLVDRGPDSCSVVQWAMTTTNVKAIKGNHEDMMIDYLDKTQRYDYGVWMWNGGANTMASYDDRNVSDKHKDFLRNLPINLSFHGLYLSHAPFCTSDNEFDMLWNRDEPIKIPDTFQVFGHNAHWGLRKFDDYAICIDTSRQRVLTALYWQADKSTYDIIQQEYI